MCNCLFSAFHNFFKPISESSKITTSDDTLPSPIVPSEDFEFRLPHSHMGAYSKAAVSTDTRPCAKVGT